VDPKWILKQVTEAMELDDLSDEAKLDQVLDLSETSIYFTYTARALEEEALRWLKPRACAR
jgi:hypothetical protein